MHGVLDQAAVGVAQVAELHGLARGRGSTTSATSTPDDLAEARALALFTIGETPWSDAQRDDDPRPGARRRRSRSLAIHSATDACYGWDEYGALVGARFDGHPWTQTWTSRSSTPDHPATAHLGADVALARRGVPVPRPAARRRRCCCGCPPTQLDLDAPGARAPDVRLPARRGASPRARAACSRPASVTSPARGRARRTSATSPAGSRGRSATDALSAARPATPARATSRRGRSGSSELAAVRAGATRCPRRRPDGARRRGATASRARLATLLGAAAARRCRSTSRCSSRSTAASYRRDRDRVRHRSRRCPCPRTSSCPHDRARAGPGGARDPRSRAGQGEVCGLDTPEVARRGRRAPRRLRAPARRARATSCSRPTSAASASAPTGSPPDQYHCDVNLVHAAMAGVATRSPQNLWDLAARARRARATTRSSTRAASAWSASRTARR